MGFGRVIGGGEISRCLGQGQYPIPSVGALRIRPLPGRPAVRASVETGRKRAPGRRGTLEAICLSNRTGYHGATGIARSFGGPPIVIIYRSIGTALGQLSGCGRSAMRIRQNKNPLLPRAPSVVSNPEQALARPDSGIGDGKPRGFHRLLLDEPETSFHPCLPARRRRSPNRIIIQNYMQRGGNPSPGLPLWPLQIPSSPFLANPMR